MSILVILCDVKQVTIYSPAKLPTQFIYKALKPKNPRDEEKLFSSLTKLKAEDPVLDVTVMLKQNSF